MHVSRHLDIKLPAGQSCFVWGARKTGKSTYLKARFPDALYIDLLKADTYERYSTSPSKLREEIVALLADTSTDLKVIIDEVQRVPLLLDEVHHMIEAFKGRINFILCGSSVRKLRATGANLLGGRAWRYSFRPFCYPELKSLDWSKIFNQGLIPSHYLASQNVDKHLASYLYDYILPEVQFEANLRKRDMFARFLGAAGPSSGEMVRYSNIARDSGVDAKTVKTYFEILEDMYLGYQLHPFRSKTKRQVITDTAKFYMFDTGLANYLRRYEFTDMRGVDAGKSFEHYVFLELTAYKDLHDKRDQIAYWRTKDGHEVDFIFQNQAVEVKLTNSVDKSHARGLLEFKNDHESFDLNIVCLEPRKRITMINDTPVTIWPIQDFLDALWGGRIWS